LTTTELKDCLTCRRRHAQGQVCGRAYFATLWEADRDRGAEAEVAKKHRVSEQTIYTWRKRFGAIAKQI
jgi:hypothetical protein